MKKALAAATVGVAVLLTATPAFAQTTDPTLDGIETLKDQFLGYAGPLALAVVALVGAFVGIPLIVRYAKMLRRSAG